MGYVVYLNRLSFQPVDDKGLPTGDPETVERGGDVPSYVPPFVINALSNAGMIVDAGPRNAEIRPIEETPTALPSADQPPTPDGLPPLLDLGVEPSPESGAGDTSSPVVRPAESASKAKWEAYATSVGIDQAEAESLSKAELQTRVAEREAITS